MFGPSCPQFLWLQVANRLVHNSRRVTTPAEVMSEQKAYHKITIIQTLSMVKNQRLWV